MTVTHLRRVHLLCSFNESLSTSTRAVEYAMKETHAHRTEPSQSSTLSADLVIAELRNIDKYPAENCGTALLPDGTTYRDAAKQMIALHPGVGYWALGRTLGNDETIAVDGREPYRLMGECSTSETASSKPFTATRRLVPHTTTLAIR